MPWRPSGPKLHLSFQHIFASSHRDSSILQTPKSQTPSDPAFSRTATLLAKEKTLKHIFDAQYDDPESSHHFDGCAYVLEVHYRVIYRSFTRIWETGHDAC